MTLIIDYSNLCSVIRIRNFGNLGYKTELFVCDSVWAGVYGAQFSFAVQIKLLAFCGRLDLSNEDEAPVTFRIKFCGRIAKFMLITAIMLSPKAMPVAVMQCP